MPSWPSLQTSIWQSLDERRPHDVPLRRLSDERERITRHQREHGLSGRIEDVHIFRVHDKGAVDTVCVGALRGRESQCIAGFQVLHGAKRRIPMPGDADVSTLPRPCSLLDVSGRPRQRVRAAAFDDGGRERD